MCITQIAKVHKLPIQNFQLPFKLTRCSVGDPSMRTCAEIYVRYTCLREYRTLHNSNVSLRIRATWDSPMLELQRAVLLSLLTGK